MSIPNQILPGMVSGVPGEWAFSGPGRALSALIDSTTSDLNVFGRAFTYKDEAVESVQAGGTGLFAGIMTSPKAYALDYNYAFNGTVGEFAFMGELFVELTTTGATIGDLIYFDNATGALGHGTATTGQTQVPNCVVSRHNVSPEVPTLAVIKLTN